MTLQQKHLYHISPYERFYLALKSSESKRQYPRRLQKFLDFLQVEGSNVEEKCLNCFNLIKGKTNEEVEDIVFKFIIFQNKRIDNKEIGPGALKNYMKAIKLFFKMNRIHIMWDMVKTIIPPEQTASDDKIPTIEEIRKLIEYPDRRIKTIVLVMLSSGIRLGAWDYLKWKHVIPIYSQENNGNNNIKAAKIIVYAGEEEEYFSFITPEAYLSLKEWMEFRQSYGEKIIPDSWLMRNTWKKVNVKQGSRAGLATKPLKFQSAGIRILMGRAWHIQNIRGILEEGEKRHEFKSTHGFRKFFKSNCEQAMKSLHVEMLMGHNTGLAKNYYRPKENEILDDYLKAIPNLVISDQTRLSKRIKELQENNEDKDYIIKGRLQEKDDQINNLQESIKFLSNRFNAFLISQPGNNIIYDNNDQIKGIELKEEISIKAVGEVQINPNNKRK